MFAPLAGIGPHLSGISAETVQTFASSHDAGSNQYRSIDALSWNDTAIQAGWREL